MMVIIYRYSNAHMTGTPAGIVHMYGVRFVDGQGAALEVDPRTRPCDQNTPRPDQGKKKRNYRILGTFWHT